MIHPSFEEVRALAEGYDYVPVAAVETADTETPVSVFMRFRETSPYCFLLDSVEGGEKWARYSFIGRDPLLTIRIREKTAEVRGRDGSVERIRGNPFQIVQVVMDRFRSPRVPGLPRLAGGAVGFFGYDMVRAVEKLPFPPGDDLQTPDCHLMVADEMIAFDHLKQKITIVVHMGTKGDLELNYRNACERLESISRVLRGSSGRVRPLAHPHDAKEGARPVANMSREAFTGLVERAREYILNGDIFQVVLSQRLSVPFAGDPFDVYRRLRLMNPSPYMFYLQFDSYCIAGASPELLVRCEDGVVETCPIAGTRRRGDTPEEDEALEAELLADEKEAAEHRMLVDLGRNDIGRVAAFGSVEVTEYMKVMRYSRVMHICSTVRGRLREGLRNFDALTAVLPAGTLSGAPKVRAMEIIDELEPTARGPYGGAVGYVSFDGNLDCCITIRTILFKDGAAHVQAGAGIVADSAPEAEYEESLNKAFAPLKAVLETGE